MGVDKVPFKCLTVRGDKFKKLSDIDKFKKLDVKPGKELSLLLKHEDKLVYFLKGIIKYIGKKASLHRVYNQARCMGHLKYINLLFMVSLN